MKMWIIWSNEHNAWWAPERNGYIRDIAKAGRYETKEAVEIVENANRHQSAGRLPNEVLSPSPELVSALIAFEDLA